MELIKCQDICVVSRVAGVDEEENELTFEVYNGECGYQQGVQTYKGWSQRDSVVFIPGYRRMLENDYIQVKLSNGIKKSGKIKTVRNVYMPLSGERWTRLELEYDKNVISEE